MYSRHTPPTVINGKVYVATLGNEVRIYGLRTYDSSSALITSPPSATPFCSAGMPLVSADFDGNALADIACFDRSMSRISIALNPDPAQPLRVSSTLAHWCGAPDATLAAADS